MTDRAATPRVFISYSHKDGAWKDRVLEQLRVLESAGELVVWDDQRIQAGDEWLSEIEAAMSSAEVAVLLVSADFLTSAFVRRREIPRLLERRQADGLRIIPVFVRPCAWEAVEWLAGLQGRPGDGKALSELRRHQAEKQLAALALGIRLLLGRGAPGRPVMPPEPEVPQCQNITESISEDGNASKVSGIRKRGFFSTAERFWAAAWNRRAPTPIILGLQWILGVFILHWLSPTFGTFFGTLSPLWLLPMSYMIVRFITRDPNLARLVGGLAGGIIGASVSQAYRDWALKFGLAFGAFFGGLLAAYRAEPAKEMRVLWAVLGTVLLAGCLDVFKYTKDFLDPPGAAFVGTALAMFLWINIAIAARTYPWAKRVLFDRDQDTEVGED